MHLFAEQLEINKFDIVLMSKIERGLVGPPSSKNDIRKYAVALGIQQNTDSWHTFFDLATKSIETVIPPVTDKELINNLPLICRLEKPRAKSYQNIDNSYIEADLYKLAATIRKALR